MKPEELIGKTFLDWRKRKNIVVNVFDDGKFKIITHRYHCDISNKSIYVTDFYDLFIIAFENGLKFE